MTASSLLFYNQGMAHLSGPICYVVTYRDSTDGSVVTLKVRTIEDSSLGLTFIALSNFQFETSSILVNPEEEARKKRFEPIKTLHLSIYSVMSIAEMGVETPKLIFKKDKSNLVILQHQDHHTPPKD